MERKIGEIFEYNGEWYQCVEGTWCKMCDLRQDNIRVADCPYETKCLGTIRYDGKSVIFKKLEKVGEPYVVHDHSRTKDVTVQDYKLYKSQGACYDGHETLNFCPYGKIEEIVAIEIKQTKEDMDEKKPNLKPFDIQKAREGKPVCTRDGRKVRIICFDAKDNLPIIALITNARGDESLARYKSNGRFINLNESDCDLMMLPEKKEGWVNVYDADTTFYFVEGMVYDTKEEAIKHINPDHEIYTTTVKIEWEE